MPYQEYIITGGLETKAPGDRIADGHLQRARGCVYDTLGCVKSDPGRRLFRTLVDKPVYGEGDAVLGGTRYRFTKCNGRLYRDGTNIGAMGTGTGQIYVVPYNDYVYITDGEVFKRYSIANGLQDVGLDRPDVVTTPLSVTINASSAGALSAGAYKWVLTYYNGVAESNFSDPMSGTATDADTATVPTPATWADTATSVRVYRTVVGGDAFFYVGEVTTEGGTFTDTGGLVFPGDPDATENDEVTDEPRRQDSIRAGALADKLGLGKSFKKDPDATDIYDTGSWLVGDVVQTNLGVLADWNDHDPPPDGLKHIIFITDRIYGIAPGNKLRVTKVVGPEHWSEYNEVPIGRQTGETLKAIMPLGPDCICYTDAGIWRFRPQGEDLTQSQLIQLEAQVGLVSEYAVTDLEDGTHIFLGENAVYWFDGRAAKEISFAIEGLFTNGSNSDYIGEKRYAVAASLRDKVWISYGTTENGGNNRTLYIDLQDPANPKFSVLLYGFVTLRRNMDNTIVGGDHQGRLFTIGDGSVGTFTTSTEAIFDITTKSFPFQGPTLKESYDRVVFDVDTGSVDMQVSLRTDVGDGCTFNLNTDGRERVKRWLPAELTGRWVDATFRTYLNTRITDRRVYGIGFGFESEGEP
jgi:hypothetical protein